MSASQASYSNKPLLIAPRAETGRPRVLRAPKMPSASHRDLPHPDLLHTRPQGNLPECKSGHATFRRSPSRGAELPRAWPLGSQPALQLAAVPPAPAWPAVTRAGPCSARPGGLHTAAGVGSGPLSLRHSISGPRGKTPATPPWRGHPAWQTTGTCGTRGEHSWNSPGKNTGVGCHFLLQEIFQAGIKPVSCRWILYCLSHQGSPEL